ncbi:MAG: hypothetical protein HOH04_00120 [Rhodospirillaceae bacterium]|jgi:hypothetical protein|nr:hypothetical protein [Rhodospirillaceae bacterium]
MSHHRLNERPRIQQEDIDDGIRRAHKLRSEAFGKYFRKALDTRYRALSVTATPRRTNC